MLKKFKKQMKNEKGLTLIELLAVIVILAIIAAIAVPAIGNIIAKSNDRAILADAATVLSGAKLAIANNECTEVGDTITCKEPALKGYVEGDFLGTTDTVTKKTTTTGTGTDAVDTTLYTIQFAKFADIKKIDVLGLDDKNTLTEEQLLTAMGN